MIPNDSPRALGKSDLSSYFLAIRSAFSSTLKKLNDSPDTAPSRRVKAIYNRLSEAR